MFDQQNRAYEYSYGDDDEKDTEVVDVEEPPSRLVAVPRVPTGDLTVHVLLDDGWHRLDPNGAETACPREDFHPRNELDRRIERVLKHPLARCECWTSKERAKADRNYFIEFGVPYVEWKGK
jgi:hypothetical protein